MFKYEYEPISPKGGKSVQLLPGRAHFKIRTAENYVSKAGNSMLKIELSVKDIAGTTGTLFFYLSPGPAWKVHQFLSALGQEQLYNERATINPTHLIGQVGECILKKESNPEYGDQCKVDKFVPVKSDDFKNHANQEQQNQQNDLDDDIPF